MPTVTIRSEEVNALVFRYLEESGFRHAAFAFHHESQLEETGLLEESIQPGALIRVIHKGLQYMRLEQHVNQDGTEIECDAPFSLIQPHECSIKSRKKLIDKQNDDHSGLSTQQQQQQTSLPSITASSSSSAMMMRMDKDDTDANVQPMDEDGNEHGTSMDQNNESNERRGISSGQRGGRRGGVNNTSNNGKDRRGRRETSSLIKADEEAATATMSVDITPVALDKSRVIPDSQVLSLMGHEAEVYVGAWNPKQSDIYASGSGDGTARIWKLPASGNTTAPTASILSHPPWPSDGKNQVTTLCWNPTGTLLATGSFDGQVRIWTLEGAMRFLMVQHTGPVFALKWNKSGTMLVSGSADHSIVLWETIRGEEIRTYRAHAESVLDLDWRDDTTFASSSIDKTICIFSTTSSEPTIRFEGHENEVNCVRWDPTGQILASSADDATAKTWSMDCAQAIHTLVAKGPIYAMQWRPILSPFVSGQEAVGVDRQGVARLLATASFDFIVRLWNADTGDLLHTLTFHTANVYSLGFSRDGCLLASGSFDFQLGVWDVQEGTLIKSYQGSGGIFEVGWNADNTRLAACFSNNKVVVLDSNSLH
ncbi:WD40-repeat-containing domain protein [Syncephalis fuscata]|nr:WD40-repeat-containing domain protein [Syncephalis fuscata]